MIARCNDMEFVKEFMYLPEIKRFAEEYGSAEKEFNTTPHDVWLAYLVDNDKVGLINVHVMTGTMCMFHPYILREYRRHYMRMVKEFISHFFDTIDLCKLNVTIPVCFPGAINAARRAGMAHEGTDRSSYLTAEGPVDRMLFGITREETRK
jgi:RimJ/RimL family protein N-acetyltransferase